MWQIGVTSCEKDRQFGPQFPCGFGKLGAGHLRHRVVGDEKVDLGAALQDLKRPRTRIGFDDIVAKIFNMSTVLIAMSGSSSTTRMVAREILPPPRRTPRAQLRQRWPRRRRQPNSARGAATHFACQPQRSIQLIGEAMDHGQAKARAFAQLLGGEEGFGRFAEGFRIHAVSRVADDKAHVSSGWKIVRPVRFRNVDRDRQIAALRHGVAGIDDKIE